jgi:hypothetical protein
LGHQALSRAMGQLDSRTCTAPPGGDEVLDYLLEAHVERLRRDVRAAVRALLLAVRLDVRREAERAERVAAREQRGVAAQADAKLKANA